MSTSLVASLLLVAAVACVSNSALGEPLKPYHHWIPAEANVTSIIKNSSNDEVLITFQNDMPPSEPEAVNIYFNLEPKRLLEPPGAFYMRSVNRDRQTGLVYWGVLCAIFYQYDPAIDGGHANVYWSVRLDGMFHSWDKQKWDLRATWRNDNCG